MPDNIPHTPVANFNEEQSAKIPALALLMQLGYQFIPPAQCSQSRDSRSSVILPTVLREVLASKTFPFMGREHSLSEAAIDKICLLYTSPSPRDRTRSRMPSSA